ncbi:helix-turn-helix domain-containing protein [Streptomyces adustus]|uniref:Helix-turn-helix domain-containing protein n=1 Tax=Streptomyces adustus TaxID=1609272 RepID=A0A5N8VRY9_9ACTN|nr:helix-turn-helix domain-containing protein [Streptomyces adustus]MPY36758.1 helix-turn-helix domain-containing protein [Streptomyces adustus]
MHDESDRRAAHAELRRRLDEGRARARLDQTQLAGRAGLGRGTVSKALSPKGGVPSVDTVTALARVLKLPVGELLELRRTAAGETAAAPADLSGLGRSIGQWEPHELEVHPAGTGPAASGVGGVRALPGYVAREHDRVLAEAVAAAAAGRSGIVVLVGTSSTGKTRACWQAVQPLAEQALTGQEWRLWHPFDPTRAEAALEDLHQVGPRTVVWLNEAQHYLGDQKFGEQIAAAVHRLLTDTERGPVLVLGTLWPEYAHDYTALPAPGRADPYSRVRELLAGRTLSVPDTFDTAALAAATALAEKGDELLADALTRAGDGGRITQDLAGAPELLNRYQHATGPARALLEAAMDARRLGVGLHLPQAFLTDAAPGYLSEGDYDQLTDDWAEQAYAQLAEPVHGKQAPLRRTTPRPAWSPSAPSAGVASSVPSSAGPVFRLADYLEQHGRSSRRHLCPPASFWHAAHTRLTHPEDLARLTNAAAKRHRLQWAHHLRHRAADHGDTDALYHLAMLREESGDRASAETLARQAADHGNTDALVHLAEMREKAGDRAGAETLARQAADHGNTDGLVLQAWMREKAGDRAGAETLYRQAADHGDTNGLVRLAEMREEAGDRAGAETLARQAADHGDTNALVRLAEMREEAGDRAGAETLARQAADHGDTNALVHLAEMREEEEAGDWAGAETLYRQAADHGDTYSLVRLAKMREEAGDRAGAETLYRQAADHGDTNGLVRLAGIREEAGDRAGAETLARQAADHGKTNALTYLAWIREEAGDWAGAETLARQAADHGDTNALVRLAGIREEAGDRAGAETLYRQAADHGDTYSLARLAEMREEAGDRAGAETLARQAADHGQTDVLLPVAKQWKVLNGLWPYGLEPDGTPTAPWQ